MVKNETPQILESVWMFLNLKMLINESSSNLIRVQEVFNLCSGETSDFTEFTTVTTSNAKHAELAFC